MSPTKWIESTNAKGIVSKPGNKEVEVMENKLFI
jgi:hypothetical protein